MLWSGLWPTAVEVLQAWIVELSLVALWAVARVFQVDLFQLSRRGLWALRLGAMGILGRRYALVYTDCDEKGLATERLADKLTERLRTLDGPRVRVLGVDSPRHFEIFPLMPQLCDGVVIMVTDVTMLSISQVQRDRMQARLERYARAGGVVVLGHDAIYRRTRNHALQTLAGCEASTYVKSRAPRVDYARLDTLVAAPHDRVFADSAFLAALPARFQLSDNETVGGTWSADVAYLYVAGTGGTSDEAASLTDGDITPLVTRRQTARGCVFWVNSGDKTQDGEPQSITTPEPPLVDLLAHFLRHAPAAL